jgi:hypothetical protein
VKTSDYTDSATYASRIENYLLEIFNNDNIFINKYDPSISLLWFAALDGGHRPYDAAVIENLGLGLEILQFGVNLHFINPEKLDESILLGDKYYSIGLKKIFKNADNGFIVKVSTALGRIADGFSISAGGLEKLNKISALWECATEYALGEDDAFTVEIKEVSSTLGSLYYCRLLTKEMGHEVNKLLIDKARELLTKIKDSSFKDFVETRLNHY